MKLTFAGYKEGFKLAEIPQWWDFVEKNPNEAIKGGGALDVFPMEEVSLLKQAVCAFSAFPGESEKWSLKLPADSVDDYALCMRAMLAAANVISREHCHPMIVRHKDKQHLALLVPMTDDNHYVVDPLFLVSPLRWNDWIKGIWRPVVICDGEGWYLLQSE